ncbi:MAG: hypothetical protein NTV07_04240, partial [Candidatus Omnitrophica bacterium]|nr:hypothetical protein [Candidatus Omnitrophota bacterium]
EEILRLIMETVHMAREQTPLAAKSDDAGSQRSAAGLMSSILRPRAANERETPAAFLKFPSPRYHIPDVEKKIRNIIDTVCKPQGSRKASLRTVDWNAVNAVMRQKRLKEFTGSEKYILHAVSIKDAAGKELLGFPMIEGSSSLLDLLPSVSYEKDGQLHIFITKGFYDDYFKISHMGRSIGQKRLQSLRLAELIDHETFEHSSAGMGLPPDERHHAAATRARYFIPPGGTISCYHRWTIDALAHNKEGRKGLEVLLDEYEFRVQEDNVQATYEKAFYEKAKRALLGRKKFSSETQIDAIHILRTYQYGDMPAFRELCKAARVDPAGLNDVIEAEEARHVRNEIDGFHPDPALTVEDTTEMNTEKDPLKRRVKKTPKRPEEKEEIFASYRKAQERLGGLIANFVIVDDAVYQEEVTPVLEYLIHLGNGTGPFEDLSGNSPEEKKASSEKKAKIGIDILNKWLECIIEAAKRGVVIGDCKLENFGVTKDGEVVLFDLAPKTFTEKEDMSDSEWCAWAAVQIKEGINEGACQLAVLGEREEIRGTYIPPDPNMKILKELRAKKWLKFLEEKMSGRYIKARYEPVPSVAIFEWPEEDPEFINDFKSTVTQSEGKAKAEWRRITFIPNEIAKEEILQLIMQNIQAPAAGKAKRATRPRRPVAKLMSSVLRPQAFAERAMRQGKDGREEFLEGWYEDKLFVFDNRVKKVRPLRIVRGDKITDPTEIAIIRRGIDEWLDTNEIKYYMVLMMAKANPAFADWYYVLSDDGSLEAFAFLADNWMGTVLEIAPWNRREKGNARRFVGLGPQFFTYCMKIMTDSSEEAGILLIHPKLQKMLDNTSAGLNRLEHRTRKHTEALMKWQRSIIERLIDQYGFAGSNRLSGDVTLPRQLYQLRNPFETDMNEGQEQWIEVRNYVSDEPTKGMFRVYVNPTREEIDKAVEIAKQVLARSDAPAAAFKYLTPDSITRGYPGNTKIVFYLATPQDVLQLVKILRSHPSYHNLAPAKALMDTIPVDSITMISGGTREDLAKRKPEAISRTAVLVEVFKAEGVSLHDGQSSFGWVIPADGAKLQSLFFVAAEQRPVKPDRNAQAYI